MGHYELMSEMATGRRRGERSGPLINRYGEEEGKSRERKAKLAQLLACGRQAIIQGAGGRARPTGRTNRGKDEAKERGIGSYNDRFGQQLEGTCFLSLLCIALESPAASLTFKHVYS